ncbi:MAG: hypothetical protein C0417_13525, partial [Chlorobiaceae bacterium]|nr:hypothetical protein [Chlorobiaceae bacterium]
NNPNVNDLLQLSSYLINRLDNKNYFESIYYQLHEEIFSVKEPSIHRLRILSQLLVIEYVEKGFTIETVIEMPDRLFNKGSIRNCVESKIFSGMYWGTALPLTINQESSIEEKFRFLKSLYNAPKFSAKAIYLILGASTKEHNAIKIDEVEFRPPLDIEFEKEESKSLWIFTSLEKEERNKPFLRALVERAGIDCFKILSECKREVLKSVDFLRYRYGTTRDVNLDVSRSWGLLNTNGEVIHQMPYLWEGLQQFKTYYEGVDLISSHQESVEFVESQGKRYGLHREVLSSNRIYQALHWIHKARESKHVEDYFMSWWIALEYLVRANDKIFDSIFNIVPSISINEIFDEIHHNLHKMLLSEFANGYMDISNRDLAEKYGLVQHPTTYEWNLRDFSADLTVLKTFINNRYVIKRVDDLSRLKNDNKELLSFLLASKKRIEYELVSIYRIRNKIVHSAEYEHDFIIHYANRIKEIVNMILENVLFYLQYYPERQIDDILIRQKCISELLLQKLDTDHSFDIYDHAFFR